MIEKTLEEIVRNEVEKILTENEIRVSMNGKDTKSPLRGIIVEVGVDNAQFKEPHVHVQKKQEKIELKVRTEDSEILRVKSGRRGENDSFSDIIKQLNQWFELPSTHPRYQDKTNREACILEWYRINPLSQKEVPDGKN